VTGATGTFGDLLRHYRAAALLTQEELAERAGLSAEAIGTLERGARQRPQAATVQRLADALALSAAERAALHGAAVGWRAAAAATHSSVSAGPGRANWPLVGRSAEATLLQGHLRATPPSTSPPLLLLAGEPGIGKTRLLQEAAVDAEARGWRVLYGSCQRRGGQAPYAPLLEALQAHIRARPSSGLRVELQGCAWLVRLLPELAAGPIPSLPGWTLSPDQEQRLMWEAVARFLANVAGASGTLLLLDDLPWAGSDALGLLASLLRSATAGRLRVAGAYRDTEVSQTGPLAVALADLAHAGLAIQHQLEPLGPQEAAELLDHLLVENGDADLADGERVHLRQRLLRRAGGVPYFLVSCAQGLQLGAPGEHHQGAGLHNAVPWTLA
jgi:transcriptional regulator with XRE-family HTH domain